MAPRNLGELLRLLHSTEFKPNAAELLEFLHFWKAYPLWLSVYRAVVRNAWNNPDKIMLVRRGHSAGERLVPVKNLSNYDKQISLPVQEVPEGRFFFVGLEIGGGRITTLAEALCMFDRLSITVTEFTLPTAHQDVERVLLLEAERRNLDGSALKASGNICRQLCQDIPDLGPANGTWPECIRGSFQSLHPRDQETIAQSIRVYDRLESQLILAQSTIEAVIEDRDGGKGRGTTTAKSWQPKKPTQHIINLMKQGLSDDAIAERADVKVEKGAENLRQIRSRARKAGLLPALDAEKRDAP